MNFRKLRKNSKALSPVIASIILIAVTVAVSVAVAAWMGALTFGFTNTEQVSITNVANDASSLTATVRNSGSANVVINDAYVNGVSATFAVTDSSNADTSGVVAGNTVCHVTITGLTINSGDTYQLKLMSAKGASFIYTVVAQ